MKTSKYGQLLEKFNRSGINESPVITNKELEYLIDFSAQMVEVAIDISDRPLAMYFRGENRGFQRVLDARKESEYYS